MKGCEDCKHYGGTTYAVDHDEYGEVRETSQCARHVLATGRCKDYEPSDKAAPAPKSLAPTGESIGDILRDMDIGIIPSHKRDTEITRWYSARLKAALSRLSMARKSEPGITISVSRALRDCRAALSAPARNCDRFATVDDAKRAYIAERGHVFIWDGDSSERFERWLFAPAEGGDHANA